MNKFLKSLSIIVSLGLLGAPYGQAAVQELAPTTTQEITTLEILEKLRIYHFASVPMDDSLSSELFDAYLESLDPSRMYFSQQDLAEFAKHRYKFDDQLKKGDLQAAFDIFNRYRSHSVKRLERLIAGLPEMVQNMDFEVDEKLYLDRSESPWPETEREFDRLWAKRLKYEALSLKLAGKELKDIETTLVKRYQNLLDRTEQINAEDAYGLFINSLTQLYDPHTSYYSPRASENFNISMRLSLEGIGAVLQRQDEFTQVVRLVTAGPADKQGDLKPSDRITGVGQDESGEIVDVVGWRLDEVVELIRGPKGSTVRLQVIPANAGDDSQRKTITIVRNKVKLEDQSAQKEVIDVVGENGEAYKVGVIDVPAFYIDFEALRRGDPEYKSTTRDVRRLLKELVEEDHVNGIVMDLRNNGGGSLQEATALTGLFIESGPTVQIRKSNNRVFRHGKPITTQYYDGPLVVMINRLSASASEIFAGAIQDYGRGIIVGEQSFGKGTVQSLTPLEAGQLKLTESKFYRISGESTQHRGVVPDIAFPQAYDHENIGESSLDEALPWDSIAAVRHALYGSSDALIDLLQERHDYRVQNDPDFNYMRDYFALTQANGDRESVPLKESALKALRESDKNAFRELENLRRERKGLPPLEDETEEASEQIASAVPDSSDQGGQAGASGAAAPDSASIASTAAETDAADTNEAAEEDSDVLLLESGRILADMIALGEPMFADVRRNERKNQITQ